MPKTDQQHSGVITLCEIRSSARYAKIAARIDFLRAPTIYVINPRVVGMNPIFMPDIEYDAEITKDEFLAL